MKSHTITTLLNHLKVWYSNHYIAHIIEDAYVFLLIQGLPGKPGTKGPQGVKGGIGPVGLPGLVGDRGEAGSQVWCFSLSVSQSPLKCHIHVFILYITLLFKGPAGADGGPGTDGTRGVKVSKEIIINIIQILMANLEADSYSLLQI